MLKNRIFVFFNNTKMYRPITYVKGALNAADSELDSWSETVNRVRRWHKSASNRSRPSKEGHADSGTTWQCAPVDEIFWPSSQFLGVFGSARGRYSKTACRLAGCNVLECTYESTPCSECGCITLPPLVLLVICPPPTLLPFFFFFYSARRPFSFQCGWFSLTLRFCSIDFSSFLRPFLCGAHGCKYGSPFFSISIHNFSFLLLLVSYLNARGTNFESVWCFIRFRRSDLASSKERRVKLE